MIHYDEKCKKSECCLKKRNCATGKGKFHFSYVDLRLIKE